MRLLTKTGQLQLVFTLPVVIIIIIISYRVISSSITESIDETLISEKLQAEKFIRNNDSLAYYIDNIDQSPEIKKVIDRSITKDIFYDSLILEKYDNDESENAPYRILKSKYIYNNNAYSITLKKATVEENDLISIVAVTIILLLLALIVSVTIIQWIAAKKTWQPFYTTLDKLKKFQLAKTADIKFAETGIKEFDDLHASLNELTQKIIADFTLQKQFTENASHEMQTPLAVIRSKVELLVQSRNLGEHESELIHSIDETINKLAQLNQALLLLSKIENKQFSEKKNIALKQLLEKIIRQQEDFIEQKEIKVTIQITEQANLYMNTILADVLFGNLISNAIKHNIQQGYIQITVTHNQFEIVNSGNQLKKTTAQLFNRFSKDDASSESLGLGLAIVKQICTLCAFKIEYNYSHTLHAIIINF